MNQKKLKVFPLAILITAIFGLLSVGYLIYQKGVRNVIHATTVSFMEQIAEHDQQNMINQLKSKWTALETIIGRVDASREYSMAEVFTDLKINVVSGSFEKLYLVTDGGMVYSHTALKTKLEDMTWKDAYISAEGSFASVYREDSREQWGSISSAEPVLPSLSDAGRTLWWGSSV